MPKLLSLPNHRRRRDRQRRQCASTMKLAVYAMLILINAASAQNATQSNSTSIPSPSVNATNGTTVEEEEEVITLSPSSSPPTSSPPTSSPMQQPSQSPSMPPTQSPSTRPSLTPSISPSTNAPTTSPSNSPTTRAPSMSPTTGTPTTSPSTRPSLAPSIYPTKVSSTMPSMSAAPSIPPTISYAPSSIPSSTPTMSPSTSHLPSSSPSESLQPSTSPSLPPSLSPIIAPSMAPSLTEEISYSREYHQRLTVSVPSSFTLDEVAKFQYLYGQYTENFGEMVGETQILTECLVLSQQIGINSVRGAREGWTREKMFHARQLGDDFFSSLLPKKRDDDDHGKLRDNNDNNNDNNNRRKLQSSSTPAAVGYPLTMRFTMRYGTRVGVYDISTYNQKFAVYINSHLTKVVEDLTLLGLPVVSAGDLLLLQDKGPTKKPTMVPTTPLPTKRPVTMSPTGGPTMSPISTEGPTMLPSEMPSDGDSPLIEVDVTEGSFKLGLGLGLGGAFMISALALLYYRHMEKKRPRYGNGQEKDHQPNQPNQQTNHGSMDGYHTNHHGSAVDTHMEMGNDSPSTIELTPNDDNHADDRMNRSEHHIHHSELALHGEVNRSRSLDAMDAGQQASGTPQRSVRSGGPSTSQPQPRSGSFVYTTGEPFGGGEIMDSIFAPTQSTSPSASNNAAGYNDMFATTLPDHREGFAVVASVHHDHHPSMNHHMNDLMINDASFSSDSEADNNNHHDTMLDIMDDEIYNPSLFDGSRDELDNYKNQDLETLRTMIEEEIDEMEGMMSLAMTRALTEPEDASMESLPWAGAQDNGSIEASCLCETYDWWKRCDEKSSLDSINEYFQDILNRIVITVMFGMTSPLQGAQIVHGCAAILGLDLLKQLPVTTLVITGMRKTNDLAQGHNFIVKAFKTFGTIEEAAIAPNNRGFGFVRFAKPESVQRALKKYREFEIEIQDVSVSIKTLKSERPR